MKLKFCLPIIKSKTSEVIKAISQNYRSYDFFEIWLDYIEDLDLSFVKNLVEEHGKKLIFLFRRQSLESPKIDPKKRVEILNLLSKFDCLVDLDISQRQELQHSKNTQLICSYHNYKETPSKEKLEEIIQMMKKYSPEIYKISTFCKTDNDALRLINLNISLKEKSLKCIVLGMGKTGSITRITAAILKDPFLFAPVSNQEKSAAGQFTKKELEKILRVSKVCFFIADPVEHSLSPKMHLAGYKALGLENNFLYLRKRVLAEDLKKAINEIRKGPHFRGASISIPHKVNIMKYLDKIDNEAKIIGAVNTIINNNGKLIGFNTDSAGAVAALEEKINLTGKTVAVIGAGGGARAIVYGLVKKGAIVTIFNRTNDNARNLSLEFNCKYGDFDAMENISNMDIIINATPIGTNEDKSPIAKKFLNKNQIVLDVVYSPRETRLIKDAKAKGARIVYGNEMLLYQGVAQFELFTNKKAPLEIMRKALL